MVITGDLYRLDARILGTDNDATLLVASVCLSSSYCVSMLRIRTTRSCRGDDA